VRKTNRAQQDDNSLEAKEKKMTARVRTQCTCENNQHVVRSTGTKLFGREIQIYIACNVVLMPDSDASQSAQNETKFTKRDLVEILDALSGYIKVHRMTGANCPSLYVLKKKCLDVIAAYSKKERNESGNA
jgi:hypothetical protein